MGARPGRRSPARAPGSRLSPSARSTASRSVRGERKRRGMRTPAPAQSRRAAFSFMSPDGGAGDDGAAAGERTRERAVPGVADDDVAAGHRARVGEPLDEARVLGHGQRPRGQPPVPGGEHAHGLAGEPSQRGAEQRCSASWAVEGATSTSGSSPGGSSTSAAGGSHMSGPTTWTWAGHATRILELGIRGDEREFAADAAVHVMRARAGRAGRACG